MCGIFNKKEKKQEQELIKKFTLIDAFNQFWNVLQENGNRRSLLSAYQMYGYLCHLWNGQGRPASFRRQNNSICAEIGVSKPTLERQRQILKNAGLIDFCSNGKGDSNITYAILDVSGSKNILLLQDEKEKNFTSPVTSPVTSGVTSQPLEAFTDVDLETLTEKETEYREKNKESKENLRAHEPLKTEKEKKEPDTPPPIFSPPNLKGSNLFREPVIPKFEEVHLSFLQNGGTEEMAKAFFDKNGATEWFLKGSPIVNFRNLVPSYISNWKKNEELKNKRNGSFATPKNSKSAGAYELADQLKEQLGIE